MTVESLIDTSLRYKWIYSYTFRIECKGSDKMINVKLSSLHQYTFNSSDKLTASWKFFQSTLAPDRLEDNGGLEGRELGPSAGGTLDKAPDDSSGFSSSSECALETSLLLSEITVNQSLQNKVVVDRKEFPTMICIVKSRTSYDLVSQSILRIKIPSHRSATEKIKKDIYNM